MGLKQKFRRLRKQLVGQELWIRAQYDCPKVTYGDWCICPVGLDNNSVMYSLGVGDDINFDLGVMNDFGMCTHAFDPTPDCIQWMETVDPPDRFHLHPYGVYDQDGEVCMNRCVKRGRKLTTMFTVVEPGEANEDSISIQARRLKTIAEELQCRIGILKMDIEGAEYRVIADMINSRIYPYQVLVEFHHRFDVFSKSDTRNAIRSMNDNGYRIFHISDLGREFSFIHISSYLTAHRGITLQY